MYLVLFDLIILVGCLYASNGTNAVTTIQSSNDGQGLLEVEYCAYMRNYPLLYAQIGYKAVLMLISCVIAVRLRNIPGPLAGSRVLLVIGS